MERYRIRAHHGMCLAFFEGKGYSNEFTEHMGSIKKILGTDPVVKLVASTDDICAYCPGNQDGVCGEAKKVAQYDSRVLELCGIKADTELEWKTFEALVWDKILRTGLRKEICGDCEWDGLCSKAGAPRTES